MPRRCTICTHSDRLAIEERLRNGLSYRALAGQFRISYSALQRHVEGHMAADDRTMEGVRLTLQDVRDVAGDMAKRQDLIEEMLDDELDKPWPKVNKHVVISLLRMQQVDEDVVLRVSGVGSNSQGHRSDSSGSNMRKGFRDAQEADPQLDPEMSPVWARISKALEEIASEPNTFRHSEYEPGHKAENVGDEG